MTTTTAPSPSSPAAASRPPKTRAVIAYLNSEYPSLSHTFIEREIRALRALGFRIQPFSIRPVDAHGALGTAHEQAQHETVTLLASTRRLIGAALASFFGSPLRSLRVCLAAQRLSPPGLAARFFHCAYAAEAMLLARELRSRGIRHVHVHMANNGAAVALLAAAFDPALSYSLTIHGSAEFFHVDTWSLKPKAEAAAFVRCISNFCRAQVMTWTSPDAWDRFHIVHCGIDPDFYTPAPPKPRRPGTLRLLTVGRLHPIKGYNVLLEACALLSRAGRDWSLDMVGDGPMRPALERKAAELGIISRVRFSGAVGQDAIREHFDDADAMVISSFMEGVPVVLMEAMAKQLAVVATRVGGIQELVQDGVSGLMVDPGSARSLADALERLAREPETIEAMGRAGRRAVLAEYTIDRTAAGVAELFDRYGPAPETSKES